ncbi:hypothetical protein FNH22_21580 [Fulvivirga sp. M361]|uniref:hypothetical protein n=1 Tax=Fulvivirga sp. M361 TaxID=2594266 RepID=UPI00117B2915|nr:hypothetical protein [Fulvivirga sp. M361]TRX52644.1 hypothetical protein FNH22_21580 [Fulvivirga sp. M361]
MKKRLLLFLVFISSFSSELMAQKVKYKDLYPLLESSQYELAIPLLRNYLTDAKGALNTNANVQLAVYMEQQAMKSDVLKEPQTVIHFTDTAITYYRKSRGLLTEKELKKNDTYYAQYERRDVRTGKVGVKLSDIQYQWDKKIESLTRRNTLIVELQGYLERAVSAYARAQEDFQKIKNDFPTEKALYLKASEILEVKLDSINKNANKAIINAGKVKTVLDDIEKAGYDPIINLMPLESYEKDGITAADFTSDKIDLWDYEKWIDLVEKEITEKIYPLRAELVTYDEALVKLKDRLISSFVATADLIKGHEDLAKRLMKIDPDPLPIRIFDVKESEITYLSELMIHSDYEDSVDLDYRVAVLQKKLEKLSAYDSLVKSLANFNWKGESEYYQQFVSNSFDGKDGLAQFVSVQESYTNDELKKQKNELESITERSKWLIDEVDSIPLFEIDSIMPNLTTQYLPMVIEQNFTTGLRLVSPDSVKGYFSLITKSKEPKSKVYFQVRKEYMQETYFTDLKGIVTKDDSEQVFHLMFYAPMPEQETYLADLCKVYASDGLAWETSFVLDTSPKSLEVGSDGNVVIDYDLENYQGDKALPDQIVFDKKGKVQ